MTKIAIIVSKFNVDISATILSGVFERLSEQKIDFNNVDTFTVDGAIEIPIVAKNAANTKKYKAIICIGSVIMGKTDHYFYVCNHVSYGCQKVALDNCIPVIFGVLTVKKRKHAVYRARAKGKTIAQTALDTIKCIDNMQGNLTCC